MHHYYFSAQMLLFVLIWAVISEADCKTTLQPIFSQYAVVDWEATIGITSFSFSDGLNFMMITTNTPTDPFFVYHRQNSAYSLLHKGYCDCTDPWTQLKNAYMSSDGSQVVASYSDNIVRIYTLNLYNITIAQSFALASVGSPSQMVYATGGYIVAYDIMILQAYKLQQTKPTSAYTAYSVITVEDPSLANSVVAISSDGQYIVTGAHLQRAPFSFMMNVYTNGKSGYAYSSQMQALNPKDTNVAGGVQKILISSSIGGSTTYFVVAMIKYGEEYSVKFFKLKDTSLSWVQDILSASTLEVGGGYLTKNGLYLSVALADRKMSLYQYDSSTDKFIIAQQVWSFYAVPSSSFIDQNAQVAAGAISQSQGTLKDQIVFYVACNVTNCLQCFWPGQCSVCSTDYIVDSAFQCSCSANSTTLADGTCLKCSVDHCSKCSAIDYCSKCTDGYTASLGSCICSLPNNISLTDGTCISCNVPNCYRCDRADICSVYQYVSSSNSIVSGSETSSNCNCKDTKTLAWILLLLTLVLLVLFAILAYRFCVLSRRIERVGDSSGQQEKKKRSSRIKDETGFTLLDQIKQRNPLDSLRTSAYVTPQNSAKIQQSSSVIKHQEVEFYPESKATFPQRKMKLRRPKSPPPPCDRFLKRMAKFAERQTLHEHEGIQPSFLEGTIEMKQSIGFGAQVQGGGQQIEIEQQP